MAVYVLANVVIRNREEYEKYTGAFWPILSKHGGEILSVQDHPQILEGSWPYSRTVLLRLPSEQHMREWYGSPEYQEIAKHRWSSTDTTAVVLNEFRPVASA
jgi:uncharacterized protein (DUF1330 family)